VVPRKGVALAIRTVARLRQRPGNESTRLDIVGPTPKDAYLRELTKIVEDSGLRGCVRFVGAVSQRVLRKILACHDVLLVPSENGGSNESAEGCPNVVLEAWQMRTPVVAAAVRGIEEIVDGEETGLLVADRTPDAWADAVERLRDRELAVRLVQEAQLRCQMEFGIERYQRRLDDFVNEAKDGRWPLQWD